MTVDTDNSGTLSYEQMVEGFKEAGLAEVKD